MKFQDPVFLKPARMSDGKLVFFCCCSVALPEKMKPGAQSKFPGAGGCGVEPRAPGMTTHQFLGLRIPS